MVIDLASLRIIQADVPEPVKDMVMAWVRTHQRELQYGLNRLIESARTAAPASTVSGAF